MIATLLLSFAVLLCLGTPVVFAIAAAAMASLAVGNVPLTLVTQRAFAELSSFVLVAIPLFMLAASIMNAGGITDRLLRLARETIGFVRGGLALSNILTNFSMAGISGSAIADAAGIGRVMIPAMQREGYSVAYASALTAAAAVVAPIIPPSIAFIIAATAGGLSVMDLFLAGVVPGVLMVIGMMVTCYLIARWKGHPRSREGISGKEFLSALRSAVPSLLIPFLIIGGVRFGWYTVTEAAAVAAALALFVGGVIHRELTFSSIINACVEAVQSTGAILLIMAFVASLAWIVSRTRLTNHAVDLLAYAGASTTVALVLIVLLVLLIGTAIDGAPGIAIMIPIFVPIGVSLGIDPIQMSTIIVVGMVIGLITPPVGILIFITSNIGNIGSSIVSRAVLPFLLVQMAILISIAFIPSLTLWLPNVLR